MDLPRPDPHVIVLSGATGDLARRKLLPGLFHLHRAGLLPRRLRIVGTSPDELTGAEFHTHVHDALVRFGRHEVTDATWARFRGMVGYAASTGADGGALAAAVGEARCALGPSARVLHHLAVPPGAVAGIVTMLGRSGLAGDGSRVIVEKPFGHDLESARALNALLRSVFDEPQVFRIDHFLGKEDVQNILAARFANGFLEPVWNREHLDNVQIDVPETLGMEGRGPFYDGVGALRDMIVTHLFQVLGFVAMEPPAALGADALAASRLAVFDALRPLDPAEVVRGQYAGYRDEPGVAAGSDTETFVAAAVHVDTERWRGVPFLLRTGKRLAEGRRVVTLTFRRPQHGPYGRDHPANTVAFEIAEPGRITISFLAKEPGATTVLGPASLVFRYASSFNVHHELEAYERLLHDAMLGDRTLFTGAAAIERLWAVTEPALRRPRPVELYRPGTWGPATAAGSTGGRRWHLPDR